MTKVAVYNLEGKEIEQIELAGAVFGLKKNDALLHQVFVAMSANQRSPIAHAKDRAERSGTGKKPFRQKGTGSARQGSSRSPLNRKGGVVFGPTKDRNFKKDLNKKMKAKATALALSGKAEAMNITVFDNFMPEEKKTKQFAKAFRGAGIKGTMLVLFSEGEKDMMRFCRNIAKAKTLMAKDVNVLDLLNHKKLVLTKETVKFLETKLGAK